MRVCLAPMCLLITVWCVSNTDVCVAAGRSPRSGTGGLPRRSRPRGRTHTPRPFACVSNTDVCVSNTDACVSNTDACVSDNDAYVSDTNVCVSNTDWCVVAGRCPRSGTGGHCACVTNTVRVSV